MRKLESPQLSLDEAMKLFEEGVGLSRECQKQLEEAEGRVEILLKRADGKIAAEPFEPEGEHSAKLFGSIRGWDCSHSMKLPGFFEEDRIATLTRISTADAAGVRPAAVSSTQAMRYSVFAGGKRIRPILCLETARIFDPEDFDMPFTPAAPSSSSTLIP